MTHSYPTLRASDLQRLDQHFFLNRDALRLLVVAIDHGGYAAVTTQCTGGSLASPVARLGRQRQRIAHRISPKSLGLNIRPFHASRDDHEKGCARVAEGRPESKARRVIAPVPRPAF